MTGEDHELAGELAAELAAEYAVGALDEDARKRFEAHIEGCAACRAEVAAFTETTLHLADAVATEPPAGLRASILNQITETPQDVPGLPAADSIAGSARWFRRPAIALAAAAVALVVVGTVGLLTITSSGELTADELAAAPDARTLVLEGEQGELSVVWSAERDRVAVVGSGLTGLGPAETYALWFVVEDGVAPAALFTVERGAVEAVLEVDDIDALGWGVTIEPAGGSLQPTGDILHVARF